jgi:hypothetical protein
MGWQDAPLVDAPASGPREPSGNPRWMSAPMLASPAQEPSATGQSEPEVTTLDRVNAGAAGVNSGIAGLLGLPVDTVRNVIELFKAGAGVAYHEATGESIPDMLQPVADRSGDIGGSEWIRRKMGFAAEVPRLDDPTSRYLHAAGQGATAAIAPGSGAARLPAVVSAITGAVAGQATADAGGGRGAQLAASLLGSVAPGAARATQATTARRSAQGGEQGRVRTGENIQAFEDAGATPSMGQATQSRRVQAMESLLARTPGSAGVFAKFADDQAANLGAGIERQASKLAPRSSGEQAGKAIKRGISGSGGFLETFKARQEQLYDELDRYIPQHTGVEVTKTRDALAAINASIPGAPNVSRFFQNAKMRGIEDALAQDVTQSGSTRTSLQAALGEFQQAAANAGGKLPYEAVKKLRTLVGREMADSGLLSDVPRSKWKELYGALSVDLEGAAKNAGSKASAAYSRANTYTRSGMKRLEMLDSVIDRNGGPESVFRAATNGSREGATVLRAVMQSLPKDGQQMVSATVLRRLGRAKPSHQDDLGDRFSAETFLTNWQSMAPEAKAVLFHRYGPTFRKDMDQIAKVAANLRQGSKVFQNPSGTGQALNQRDAALAVIIAAGTGHFGTAGAILGGAGAANLMARVLTNPTAVRWLAGRSRAPASALPALAAQLARSNDADLQELGQLIEDRVNQQADGENGDGP